MSGQHPYNNPPPGHRNPADELKTARELGPGQDYRSPDMQKHNRPTQTAAAHNANVLARMARQHADAFTAIQPGQQFQQPVNVGNPIHPNQFTQVPTPNVNEANPQFTNPDEFDDDVDGEQAEEASPGPLHEPANQGQQSSPIDDTANNIMTSSSDSSKPPVIPLEFDSLAQYVALRTQGDLPSFTGNDDFDEVRQGLASDVREMMEMFQQDLNVNNRVKPTFGPAKTDWNIQCEVQKLLGKIRGVTDPEDSNYNQLERALWELMQQLINLHDPNVATGRTQLSKSYKFDPKMKCSERLAEIKAVMNTCPNVRKNTLFGQNLDPIVKCPGLAKKRYDDNKIVNWKRKLQKEALKAKALELAKMKGEAPAEAGTKRKQSAQQKNGRPVKKSKGASRKRQETPEDELSDEYGHDSDEDAEGSIDDDYA